MGPLKGLRILDLSFYEPGKFPCKYLAILGAEVISFDIPAGQGLTAVPPSSDNDGRWYLYNTNKKSLTLNLKKAEGKRAFFALARSADAIITCFTPGTERRLGIDYEAVRQVNPEIVYCSVSGYGQDGPRAAEYGHEPNYEGYAGASGGNAATDGPRILPVILADIVGGGYNAVVAVLAALVSKLKTGRGQYIDVPIVGGLLPLIEFSALQKWYPNSPADHLEDVQHPQIMPEWTRNYRPEYRNYRTSDGGWIAISHIEPFHWERLCAFLGRPELTEIWPVTLGAQRATAIENREDRRQQAIVALSAIFASKTRAEWDAINRRENLGITPVYMDVDEVLSDPQMLHLDATVEIPHAPAVGGRIKHVNSAIRMSGTPLKVSSMPRFGEHTDELLKEVGYSDEDIAELRESGVI